jgi:hypothetical protein
VTDCNNQLQGGARRKKKMKLFSLAGGKKFEGIKKKRVATMLATGERKQLIVFFFIRTTHGFAREASGKSPATDNVGTRGSHYG